MAQAQGGMKQGGMKPFYTVLAVVGVLGLGAIGWLAFRSGNGVAIPVDVTRCRR